MNEVVADVLIIGSGLGATAAARCLATAGRSVVLVPGVGRTRFPHIDGGVVDAGLVKSAFGNDAPLGSVVREEETLRIETGHRFEVDRVAAIDPRVVFRRSSLETWAMDRAMRAGARYIEDFVEGKALPNAEGSMTLISERDERSIRASAIVLCEGADPRIPLRVHLRPDYGPEDQVHFARTIMSQAESPTIRLGSWRTNRGMPVRFAVVPQEDGVIISVAARIENVMRTGRSTKDALEEFISSQEFASLGVVGVRGDTGIELTYVRRQTRHIPFVHDRLVLGVDMSGVIDARRRDRVDDTIGSGVLLGRYLLQADLSLDGWPAVAQRFIDTEIQPRASYYEDGGTGFLEEGSPNAARSLSSRFSRLIRRGRPI